MNHPANEKWISYLYDELPSPERAGLEAHAATCAECAGQLDSWRGTTAKLNEWQLPTRPLKPVILRRALKWGIAAMLMIGFGFGLARFTAPKFDSAKLENDLRTEFHEELATARTADKREMAGLLARMEEARAVDYATLREDLETVAVTAEATLRRAQRQIGALTLIAQNENNSSSQTR